MSQQTPEGQGHEKLVANRFFCHDTRHSCHDKDKTDE